ncbi:uncharacterized protein BKA55DRAFT_579881 [Fusarium redolens]|uniref:Uncharacterized protein n=1 Tax=Fusarium redolens TaxID=48865 RepID=A0A9P9G9F1_FUSRE|nr:uncharacterized protein BKA55DRAFT_579881 [Fusarium redolens]KAH7233739.1 hypothetical protein BKA55DRAFT_579881 [Fusarium redolens]
MPPPPLATLPPVTPDGNTSCAFDSLPELVKLVVEDWAGYNISLLVDTCPGACDLVYGSGNPDISGIGAMSSYAIQGISSLLFGPILGILALYASSDPYSDSFFTLPTKLWVSEAFAPVARSIHQTNVIVAFSVLLTTLIRVRQASPVSEREFLQHLAGYEVLVSVISTLSYLPIHESSKLRKAVLCCYVLGTIIMVFIARDWTSLNAEPYASAYAAMTKYCVEQYDWPVPEISFIPPTTSSELATPREELVKLRTMDVLLMLSPIFLPIFLLTLGPIVVPISVLVVLLLLIVAFVIAFVAAAIPVFIFFGAIHVSKWAIRHVFTRPYEAVCRGLHVGPKRLGAVLIIAGVTALGATLVRITFEAMLVQRQELRAASGNAYQDNEWGFGQVAAVLAWFPAVQDTLLAVFEAIRIHYHRVRILRIHRSNRSGSHNFERQSLLEHHKTT